MRTQYSITDSPRFWVAWRKYRSSYSPSWRTYTERLVDQTWPGVQTNKSTKCPYFKSKINGKVPDVNMRSQKSRWDQPHLIETNTGCLWPGGINTTQQRSERILRTAQSKDPSPNCHVQEISFPLPEEKGRRGGRRGFPWGKKYGPDREFELWYYLVFTQRRQF